MFKKLFSKNKYKSQFLVIPELNFQSSSAFADIVEIHIVSKETALKFDSFLELVYEDDCLINAFDYDGGVKHNRILLRNEKGLPYNNYSENQFLSIILSNDGINQLGGEFPSDIKFDNNYDLQFQYLGFISCNNKFLKFLNQNLHLIVPVYSDFTQLYLDYKEANIIKILDVDENLDELENVYDEVLNQNIVYDVVRFNLEESNELGDIGHSGIPLWIQYPEIPKCPETGKNMKFLIQLNRGPAIVNKTNYFPENKLEFSGGNGNLYVFYSPESKIACFIRQDS